MTIGRPTDCLHPKGRPCDTSYLVSLKEAGVMAKKRTKRFRSEKKRPTKLRQRSGQFSLPFLPSTPSRITPFPAGDSPLELTHCHLLPRPSRRLSSSPRSSIRVRARRTYLRQLQVERSLPACEPEQHQQSATQAPSNDMPNDLNVGRGTGNRTVFRHSALIDIINKVESEEKDRDRLHGLVTCAEEFKQSQNKSCKCIGIESLGHGSWNCAYRLTFSNGDTMAALVSNYEPKAFSRTMKESEIATMQYLHSSPKYNKHIKVPEVYSWDLSHDNKAGAPYIFREVIEGKDLSREFHTLTKEQKLAVTTAIARVHKVLSQPADFNQIGGIYGSPEQGFKTGGYPGNWSRSRPYSSIEDLWKEKIEVGTGGSGLDKSGRLARNRGQLRELADSFSPPGRLSRLCIQHFDLAIRNVVFNDKFEITGVIDWEYAQVVPLAIAAKIPLDFEQDPEIADRYAAAYNDPCLGTSHEDFEDSVDYISFHNLIMGPEHATAKKYVSTWIECVTSYFKNQQRLYNGSTHKNGTILRFPPQLRALRSLEGEGPELAAHGCS